MSDIQALDRPLLLAGIAAGLLFFVVPTIEVYRRPGFDLARHAISMLSLGDGGWIMKTVFIASGLLTLACAAGIQMRMTPGWAAHAATLLVGLYGLGLVIAGVFDAPAGLGFPAGTPDDQQPVMTTGATLHGVGFMVAFTGLILACFVFAWYFLQAGQSGWGGACILAGIAMPALVALGIAAKIAPGIAFYWAAVLGWLWLGITILRLDAMR